MFLELFNAAQQESCGVVCQTPSGSLDDCSSAVTTDDGHQTFSVPLNSLAPRTDYKYVIHCWNKFDSVRITSEEMSFRISESGEKGGLYHLLPKFEHIFVAVITFFHFLLCRYFYDQLVAYCMSFKMICKISYTDTFLRRYMQTCKGH